MLLIHLPIYTGQIVFGGTTVFTVNTLTDTVTLYSHLPHHGKGIFTLDPTVYSNTSH